MAQASRLPGFDGPDDDLQRAIDELLGPAPTPIDWTRLSAEDAEAEWLDLNRWVHWLRREYGLPAAIIPPLWHRHAELVQELSALRSAWLVAYDPQSPGSAPLGWHRDFQAARERLREWVGVSGARLDRDRPTRVTVWPGETAERVLHETTIADREEDFVAFVREDVRRRADGDEADD